MKKRILSVIALASLLLTLLSGCGAESGALGKGARNEMAVTAPEAAPMEMMAADTGLTSAGDAGASAVPENRKWIVNVYMSAETEDLDPLMAALDEKISALGGYVEGQNVYNGSSHNQTRRYRHANLTIRIPAEAVDSFTEEVAGISNVVSREKSLEDITLRYVATESRMKALQTEEARLLELLAKAETMSDLLEIEARLTEVRSELEGVTSQMKIYDNQVDYATIRLNIEEVREYTPVEEPTVWQRISTGFTGSLKGMGTGIVDTFVWILTRSPYLVVYGLLITGAVLLIGRLRKKKAKKNP